MNILVINGSPKAEGTVGTLLRHAVEKSIMHHTVDAVELYDMEIKPCMGCMACRTGGHCVLPMDDGHRMAEKFRMADIVIVGTPTYWANMSGVLKNMFDRLVYVLVEDTGRIPQPRMKGRKTVIVAACTAPAIVNAVSKESAGAVKSVSRIMKMAGYNIESIEVTGTGSMKSVPKKYFAQMEKAIEIR